jgi:hypothetical protein
MKNKNLIIFSAIGLVILIGIGVFIFISGKKTVPVVQASPEEVVSTMKPEDIGLTMTASNDKKTVILKVSKTEDISALDYDLQYSKAGEGADAPDVPIGVLGTIEVKKGQVTERDITLGTCSAVCHYDKVVSDIKLILKVTKTDGSKAQVEQTLGLAK